MLLDEKSYKKTLVYERSHKNFDQYKILFVSAKKDSIFDRVRCLIKLKICNEYVVCHNYAKIKINSDDDLLLEKKLNFYQEDHDNYFYKSVFEKRYYQLIKSTDNNFF